MRFQTELVPAVLLRRYKRFLADCVLPDGREVTAHIANPGAMTGLAETGTRVWLEPNDDPKKKLDFSWRIAELPDGTFVTVDTSLANRVVREALVSGRVEGVNAENVRAEVKYGTGSRIDFLIPGPDGRDTYVEVKSATLSRWPGLAEFPDTTTARGTKHMIELAEIARTGHRAIVLWLVNRTDCARLAVAADIDPAYAVALKAACHSGVELMALSTQITPHEIIVGPRLPVIEAGD